MMSGCARRGNCCHLRVKHVWVTVMKPPSEMLITCYFNEGTLRSSLSTNGFWTTPCFWQTHVKSHILFPLTRMIQPDLSASIQEWELFLDDSFLFNNAIKLAIWWWIFSWTRWWRSPFQMLMLPLTGASLLLGGIGASTMPMEAQVDGCLFSGIPSW